MEHKSIVRIGRLLSGHEICERGAFRTIDARKSGDGAVEFRSVSYRIRLHPFCTRFAFVLHSLRARASIGVMSV